MEKLQQFQLSGVCFVISVKDRRQRQSSAYYTSCTLLAFVFAVLLVILYIERVVDQVDAFFFRCRAPHQVARSSDAETERCTPCMWVISGGKTSESTNHRAFFSSSAGRINRRPASRSVASAGEICFQTLQFGRGTHVHQHNGTVCIIILLCPKKNKREQKVPRPSLNFIV